MVLVVVSLALLSVYFRESSGGTLHGFQSSGAAVLRPFQVGAERVARPFRDLAGWFGGLVDAKSENTKLHKEVDQLRQLVIQNETAAQENALLRRLLGYHDSARFPQDFRSVGASVISRSPGAFVQQVVIAAGSNAGVRLYDPVVTEDGLVGHISKVTKDTSLVTLLTDETSAASGLDLKTHASGIVEPGSSASCSMCLDRVTKDQVVNQGDIIVTAGWRSGPLADIYPKGIPIGTVTSYSQADTDLYKRIEIRPFVDFSSLESLLVLVPKPLGS
jgi:rod shape-determining protein MreC